LSAGPEEDPFANINFGPQITFDPAQLAETVMWPLVDTRWGKDWREISHLGNEMILANRGASDGDLMDVRLRSTTYLGKEEDDCDGVYNEHGIDFEVEQHVTDERRDLIFAAANEECKGLSEFDVDEVNVKTITSYMFYTDGPHVIRNGLVVEDVEGYGIWFKDLDDESRSFNIDQFDGKDIDDDSEKEAEPEDEEEEDEEFPVLIIVEHDLEIIERGLKVFNAPQAILRALKVIKSNPVIVDS
jgi:hypothetical protein